METGFFGGATEAAVKDFQQEVGLPMTGIVDADYERCDLTHKLRRRAPAACSHDYARDVSDYDPMESVWFRLSVRQWLRKPQSHVALAEYRQCRHRGHGLRHRLRRDRQHGQSRLGGLRAMSPATAPRSPSSSLLTRPLAASTSRSRIHAARATRSHSRSIITVIPAATITSTPYGSCGCNQYISPTAAQRVSRTHTTTTPLPQAVGNCGTNPAGNNVCAPTVTYLNPVSGGVGTSVTVYGTRLHDFRQHGPLRHRHHHQPPEHDGQSVSFVVPSLLTGFGSQNTGLGIYNVSVTNAAGYSTNVLPFTVTSLGNNGSTVSFTNVNGPSSLARAPSAHGRSPSTTPANAAVTVTPTWGDTERLSVQRHERPADDLRAQGTVTLTFTHVYSTSGTYDVSFSVGSVNGTQTSAVGKRRRHGLEPV